MRIAHDYVPLMDLKQLEVFLAVFSAGSITAAARLLDRSQPAVSRMIQDLENDVGFPLLHRYGPRITPTDRGVRFHADAERLVTGIGRLRDRAHAIASEAALPIEIVAIPAFAAGLVPLALSRMTDDTLPARIHLRSAPAEAGIQSILARAADLCIASLPVEQPGLTTHTLARAPCVAAVSLSDPLADKEVIAIGDLAERRLLTMANPFRLRGRIDRALIAQGVQAARVIDANSAFAALRLAALGKGVAIIDPVTAYGMSLPDAVIRPLDIAIPFLWGVFSAVSHPLSETSRAFLQKLVETTEALIPGLIEYDSRHVDLTDVMADSQSGEWRAVT
ncbi:LysR family transcriptional regulator [Marinivivus vitaminiproducens]|uniref:LysR family transcriptional regulator n=1 Tax=Marinivivus vitaminiproducens TaxID=3035935 RepID=UPI0027A4256C|nr:LysR family transcriptional regulator [Geminicoccaceae bacterium SCSIO 64248]